MASEGSAPVAGFELAGRGGGTLEYAIWEKPGAPDVLVELRLRGDTAEEADAKALVRALDDLKAPGRGAFRLMLRPLGALRTSVRAERVLSNWAAANVDRVALVVDQAPAVGRAPHEVFGLLSEVLDEMRTFEEPDAAAAWFSGP